VRTLAIINQKGGCGKTTTAINVAGVLARLGHRTLLVDLDPQAHCAAGLGIPDDSVEFDIGQAMLTADGKRLDPARLLWRVATNLDLAPSTMRLAGLEAARGGLADLEDRDARLDATLRRFSDRFDWVVIDCPPSIGLLTYNALRAATEALIPVETSFFAMKGANRQVRTIRSLARRLGGQTPYRVVATMHDPDNPLAGELLADLQQSFGDLLVPHVIRLDRTLREATTFGRPVIDF
jgi:chromosome partitioning protein